MRTRSASVALAILGFSLALRPASKAGAASAPPTTRPSQATPVKAPGEWKSYEELHAYILHRFVTSDDFGVRRMPRVNEDPQRSNTLYVDATRYTVGPVQLVSLNNGTNPFYYDVPTNRPVKDVLKMELARAKHVPLPEPEAKALKLLNDGRVYVLVDDHEKRFLLGAVHATEGCAKCHSVKEGELLGAFRYPLTPVIEASASAD